MLPWLVSFSDALPVCGPQHTQAALCRWLSRCLPFEDIPALRAGGAPLPPSSAGQCWVMTMRSLCALVRCPGMIDDAGGDSPHACPRRSVTAHSQPQRSHSPRQTTVPTALTGLSPSSSWPAVSRCPVAAARRRARPPAFAARARPPSAQCVSPRAPCAARSGWPRR